MATPSRQRLFAGFEEERTPAPAAVSAQATAYGEAAGSEPSGLPETPAAPSVSGEATRNPSQSPERLDGQTVYVIDAHSLIYQVFHAIPEMTSPSGQPVGAVYGFVRDMADLLAKKKPNYLFCVFDHSGDTFRNEIFADYKLHREEMPTDLRPQIANTRRLLDALGIPSLAVPHVEADDVLATIARQTEQLGGECILVTSDKDCRQLITDKVRLYNIRKDQFLDAEGVLADWGIRPDQVVDFQALWGDSIDNVPGIEGIGKKIASELLQKYGDLEGVLAHAWEITAKKRRESLIAGRETVLRSRELVRLRSDLPLKIDWESGRIGGMNPTAVAELCREFGFRQLAQRLIPLVASEPPAESRGEYRLVDTAEKLEQLVPELAQQPRLAMRTFLDAENPCWAKIVGFAFAWREGEACYIPVRSPPGEPELDSNHVQQALRPIWENSAIEKIGPNLKIESIVLRLLGVVLRGTLRDVMVADYLLAPGERTHGLADLARRYLNHRKREVAEVVGTGKHMRRIADVPLAELGPFAAEEADLALQLSSVLSRRLQEEGLDRLYSELEMPLIEVLAELEFHGITVDVGLLQTVSDRFGQRMAALETEIFELAGGAFNIDSRAQLSEVLFQDLKLRTVKKTKTGPSTDVEVLTQLAKEHPLPAKIIQYRQLGKLKGTYLDALPAMVCPRTGRIHTSFRQDVAATGRLSSNDPNLQNIPIRTAEGREIRAAFVPGEPGWSLLTADYSQIELRVLAHFSRDPALLEAFENDEDIHTRVAGEVNGVRPEQVTAEMRRQAKAINFGIIYGQSPFGLAKALEIEKEEAALYIRTYFARYPGVQEFITRVLDQCRRNGYVSTMLGRRRAVQGVRNPSQYGDSFQRNLPERIAINTVIQGSAADLIKQAMIRVSQRLSRGEVCARMLLQIHDELLFESPSENIAELSALVTHEMAAVGPLAVPLRVDVKSGQNWAVCE